MHACIIFLTGTSPCHRRARATMTPCTRPCLTGATPDPNSNPRTPLGHPWIISMLTWACDGQRWLEHHYAPLSSCHGHRWASSGESLCQPRVPVDADCVGEHVGGDDTTSDLVVGVLFADQAMPLLCVLLTCGSRWPTGPSYQSVFEMFFLIYFHRFECKLQKLIYLARNIQMGWTKFCCIHLEVYYLIKIWNLLFRVFF